MSHQTKQFSTQHPSTTTMQRANRFGDFQWFEGAPNPKLASMAAEFELKGSQGSARKLQDKTVTCVGLGSVGGDGLTSFARSGVGTLLGFDFDSYELESWLTQSAKPTDAGRLKAEVQGERAHAAGSGRVLTAVAFAQDIPLWVQRKSNLMLVAGDNMEVARWGGEIACGLAIPLLQGAVHGESWTALVRAYDFREAGSPCPACAFSKADWLRQKSRTGCDPGTMRAQGEESTRTLPNICRTAADLSSSEALKVLLGVEGAMFNEELTYSLLSHHILRTRVELNPECRCPHKRWNLVDVSRSLSETTLEMLAGELSQQQSLQALQVQGELPWVSYTICVKCSRKVPVRRFGRVGAEVGSCPCGEPLQAVPMGIRSVIPAGDLQEVADTSLHDLQLPVGAAIGLEDSAGEEMPNWFFVGSPPELKTTPLPREATRAENTQLTRSIAK